MAARYAIYDTRTNSDIGEFEDLAGAFAEIDRLRESHGMVHGIRIARPHREAAALQRQTESISRIGF